MHGKKTKRVVIALDFARPNGQCKFAGIMRLLNTRKLHWDIRLKRGPGEFLPIDVQRLPDWDVDGIIYSIPTRGADARKAARILASLNKPLVIINPDMPEIFRSKRKRLAFIRTDSTSIGNAAAEHLASQPHYRSFGYLPDSLSRDWSIQRGQAFANAVAERGKTCHIYSSPRPGVDDFPHIRKWLRKLPKPTAILTAYDDRAMTIYEACAAEKLAIPDDVSILSVDNDQLLCESMTPALSSISPDHEQEGYAAAAILSQLMRGGKITHTHEYAYPIKGTISRVSSLPSFIGAGLVHRALKIIHDNIRQPITPKDIARRLHVSRSLLEQRFRSIRKNTVHAEIESSKLAWVKGQLETTSSTIKEIASACGFPDQFYLMRLFKRRFKLTMSEWRHRCARADLGSPNED